MVDGGHLGRDPFKSSSWPSYLGVAVVRVGGEVGEEKQLYYILIPHNLYSQHMMLFFSALNDQSSLKEIEAVMFTRCSSFLAVFIPSCRTEFLVSTVPISFKT